MSRSVPDRARQLAAELELRFAHDAKLARRLDDAHDVALTIACGGGCSPMAWQASIGSMPPW